MPEPIYKQHRQKAIYAANNFYRQWNYAFDKRTLGGRRNVPTLCREAGREGNFSERHNAFDKPGEIVFFVRVEMNTAFVTKTLKYTPIIGCMANWQRDSRPLGIVGAKF
jgi:hypothetical protein